VGGKRGGVPGYCGAWSAVQEEDGTYTAVPLRCRSWACPRCAPLLRRRLVKALEGVEAHRFITLTCNPARHRAPADAYRTMSLALSHLVKRIRRLHPHARFEYFAVWEATKAGWPHLHMAARGASLPQRWLSGQWRELTGAAVVDIRRVQHADQLATYLAKELAKAPTAPAGMKRFRCSRAFLQGQRLTSWLRPPTGSKWQVVPVDTACQADVWRAQGKVVYVHHDGTVTALDRLRWLPVLDLHPHALSDWAFFLKVAAQYIATHPRAGLSLPELPSDLAEDLLPPPLAA